jgi:hypothetical protein
MWNLEFGIWKIASCPCLSVGLFSHGMGMGISDLYETWFGFGFVRFVDLRWKCIMYMYLLGLS